MDPKRLNDREFLRGLRDAARERASMDGVAPSWRMAFFQLAEAASILDVKWEKCETDGFLVPEDNDPADWWKNAEPDAGAK